MNALDWFDKRTGYRSLARHALDEPVTGGARWAYVFGSALAFLFVLQAVTGIMLAIHYSASTRESWGSVWYFQRHVQFGWFIRGLHHFGSGAMVILVIAHMLQVFFYGAYRSPREVSWWTGVVLLFAVLGFALTGYLLPWDQKGYWATRVVTSILGTFPLVGTWLKHVLQGGNDFGNLTLTRFFGFHVFFLPAVLTIMLAAHIILFRRHGVTPWWSRKKRDLDAHTEPFWPRQLTYDMAFIALVVASLSYVVLIEHGAPLEAPADPSSNFLARPEWYFLWLFEMLKVFPGRFEGLCVALFSLFGMVFILSLPLADRAENASLRARWRHVSVVAAFVVVIGGLTLKSKVSDAHDLGVRKQEISAETSSREAQELAEQGIPPGGADDLWRNDPKERGRRLFGKECAHCHKLGKEGSDNAPDLTNYMSTEWVRGVIADPTTKQYFGGTKVTGMDKQDLTPDELDGLTAYLADQKPGKGSDLFEDKGCQTCHAREGEDPLSGPSLNGYGTRAWIVGAIFHPGAARYYGDGDHMPDFAGKLTTEQANDLVTYLTGRESEEKR